MDHSTLALVMLSELPGVGERRLGRALTIAKKKRLPPSALIDLPAVLLGSEYGLPEEALARLIRSRRHHEESCRRILARLEASGGSLLQTESPSYPHRLLLRAASPPPLLYSYGNPEVLSSPTLAILSSRTLTETTVSATVTIAQQAARERLTVVSGGMKGAYRIAALAARAACRAIVLDRGLFAALGESLDRDSFGLGPGRATLDASRTLVLSPFRPNNHAAPGNGRRRDELVAALADIVVAVHARPGGEMERTCLRALDRGQCVLSWNAENAGLIEAGALPLDEADLRRGLNRYLSGMRDER